MRMSVRRWLRIPMLDAALDGPCICSTSSSPAPFSEGHLHSCVAWVFQFQSWRHNDLRRTMRDMAMAAGFPVEEEPRCFPGFGHGDLLVHRHGDLSAMAVVTVTSSVQSAVVENAAVTPLFPAEKAEKRKRDQYGAACDQLRLQLVPMAVELDGALGCGTQSFLAHCRNQSRSGLLCGGGDLGISQLLKVLAAVFIGCAPPGKLPLSSASSHGRPSSKLGHGPHLATHSCARRRIMDNCLDSLSPPSLSPPPPPPNVSFSLSLRLSCSLHFSLSTRLSNMLLSFCIFLEK